MPTKIIRRSPKRTGTTLTQATFFGRNTVKYGSIGLVVLIVGRMLLGATVALWKALNPPPPPPPTVGFGALPKLNFPVQEKSDLPTSYKLETSLGNRLPEPAEDRMKVFFMPKITANLLADQEVRAIAATYGYIFEPELLNSRTYRWTQVGALNSSLEVDINTRNFLLKTDYLNKPALLGGKNLPEEYEAVSRIKSFLERSDLLPTDIATSSGEVVFLKSLGGELDQAFSLSDADFLKVKLDRNPVDSKYEFYSPEPEKGVITGIISGALSGSESIVDLEYHYKKIDYEEVHTYPLRPVRSAWQMLQAGEGFIANPGGAQEAVIREVRVGYYEDWKEQEYMQPIYVFMGDEDFVGYVQAVDPKYVSGQ